MFAQTQDSPATFEMQEIQVVIRAPAPVVDLPIYDIVDDLLEADLLGLLLSTSHFQRYCRIKAQQPGVTYSDALVTLSSSAQTAAEFQHDAMKKFQGLYIAECRFTHTHELAKHLNEKLKQFSEADFAPEAYLKISEDIENAWKYRRATQGIRA